ncbi:hypothetical protein LEP1GSC185_0628 [Leptospira licerasiae serovar Varillal str. VAR 010]|nr:hypothetical protein LEP1GSC185_0628 [Leptospira licerasiae serovar Varillal str. VAR 010]
MANQGIHSLLQLTKYSEEELLELHGIGKNAIRVLRAALKDIGKDLKLSS